METERYKLDSERGKERHGNRERGMVDRYAYIHMYRDMKQKGRKGREIERHETER